MKRVHGFSRLELLVTVTIFGIIAAVLLDRLLYYQELAEKAHMEYTITRLKSALRLQMANMLVTGRAQDISSLAYQDPITWLVDGKPANYLGSLNNPNPENLGAGSWYFDVSSRTLVYLVQRGRYFQSDNGGAKRVRWQMTFLRNQSLAEGDSAKNHPTDSVSIKLLEPYRWF